MAFYDEFDPTDEQRGPNIAPRVEDYLNDKIQNAVDLEGIDVLLDGVLKQQHLLKQQLEDARTALTEATTTSKAHSSKMIQDAQSFDKRQADINRRLLIITQSETSDEAVADFAESMDKIRRLDVAKGYITVLSEVEELRLEADGALKTSPDDALRPCNRLQDIAVALEGSQTAAEQAAPHLVHHVQSTARELLNELRDSYASVFKQVLSKMRWPSKDLAVTPKLAQEWAEGAERLLDLQRPQLERYEKNANAVTAAQSPPSLLPLKVMMEPLEMRFRYHFEGDRPTNKLDKPEYFLSHIANLLNTHDQFFVSYLQPILRSKFRGTSLAMNSIFADSSAAYITALLPLLRQKIKELLPQYSQQPRLLSHLMHELLLFDTSLRDEWGYDGGNSIEGWQGLGGEVLVSMGFFDQWLEVERKFAISRYESILAAPDARKLDTDSISANDTKPTNATVRVNDLLEAITDIYRPLTSFPQRLNFLIKIQIDIFDYYHRRLSDALEAYKIATSLIGRRVHGSTAQKTESKEDLKGMSALESLIRVYGSAEYLENKMADWSDDVFFVDMWEELQDQIQQKSTPKPSALNNTNQTTGRERMHSPITQNFTVPQIAQKTSTTLTDNDDDTLTQGSLFDETASAYRRVRLHAEDLINTFLSDTLKDALRPYTRITTWASLSSPSAPHDLSISSQLDNPLQILITYLSYLSSVLATAPLRRIGRQLALSIQKSIWTDIIDVKSFSESGAVQLSRDILAIWSVMDKYLGSNQGEQGMRRLADGLKLLTLVQKKEEEGHRKKSGRGNEAEDEDISAWDEEDAESQGGEEEEEEEHDSGWNGDAMQRDLTLEDVRIRLFRGEESGAEVLAEMGIETLTVVEARGVVQSRVEVGSR